jgi:Protein required for attachment to host cells
MDAAWVVVADSARARVFRAASRIGPLEELEDLTNSQARQHEGDIYYSEQTRKLEMGADNLHQSNDYQPARTPEQVLAERFAKEVASYLRRGALEKRYQRLVLAAGPQFLGALRNELDGNTRAKVTLELPKDLSKLRADQLRSYLPERF